MNAAVRFVPRALDFSEREAVLASLLIVWVVLAVPSPFIS